MSPRTTTRCASPAWPELLAALPGPPTASLCKAINTCFFPFFPRQHLNPVTGVLCPSPCPQAPCLLPPSCCETNLGATRVPRGGPHLVPGVSLWRGWEGAGHGVWAAAGEALATGALGRVNDVLWSLFTCSAVTCQSCQDAAVFGGCKCQVPALSFVGSPSS